MNPDLSRVEEFVHSLRPSGSGTRRPLIRVLTGEARMATPSTKLTFRSWLWAEISLVIEISLS